MACVLWRCGYQVRVECYIKTRELQCEAKDRGAINVSATMCNWITTIYNACRFMFAAEVGSPPLNCHLFTQVSGSHRREIQCFWAFSTIGSAIGLDLDV